MPPFAWLRRRLPEKCRQWEGYVSIKGNPRQWLKCLHGHDDGGYSDIDDGNEGDLVLVFGPVCRFEVAKWADTIPYEIMTGISRRVRRVYFEESNRLKPAGWYFCAWKGWKACCFGHSKYICR